MGLSSSEKYALGVVAVGLFVGALWKLNDAKHSEIELSGAGEREKSPDLASFSSFEFFSESGKFHKYEHGELTETGEDLETWRDGGTTFSVTGPDVGIVQGNMGSGELSVHRTAETLVFTERVESGANVMTVRSEWDAAAGGFRASYLRNIEPVPGLRIRTDYTGYAKPH